MIRATVNFRQGWGNQMSRQLNLKARDALVVASSVGAREAEQLASRVRTGKMRNFEAVPVVGSPDGWEGGFKSKAGISGEFYSGFQSRGTLQSRRVGGGGRQVKAQTERRRESPSGKARFAKVAGRKGITPLKHEEQALATARRHLVALLRRLG